MKSQDHEATDIEALSELSSTTSSSSMEHLLEHVVLAARPSGCVVWLGWSLRANENRVDIEYRWFGGAPGRPLPDLGEVVARHTKANAVGVKNERPGIRRINLGRFERLDGAGQLLQKLFGPA